MENDHEHGQPESESEYKSESESECKPEPQIKRKESKGKRLETAADWKREEEKKRKEKEEKKERQYPNPSGDWTDTESGESTSSPNTPHTPRADLIEVSSSEDSSKSEQEDPNDPPPEPLRQLVEKYLRRLAEEEVLSATDVARGHLNAICTSPLYDGNDYAADIAALGRARQYLRRLALPYDDIEIILRNAKAKAQVSKAPSASSTGFLNSLGGSSVMYLVTFFLGKWLTATTGIGLVLKGPAGSAALAALVNALVVPLTQAMTGDPMGAALRNFGPSVPSEDSRQYALFMTAHALHVRARISGAHPAWIPTTAMEMDRVVNAVTWREQGKPGTVTEKPLRIASGVDPIIDPAKPKAEVDAKLRENPYTTAQRCKVVACMLARILLSDELPVHTFTILNGVTGYLNTMWPALFGISADQQAFSRVVDAATHTGAGFVAMYVMFLLQDKIRPMVQGVGPIDPTSEAYLDDKTAPLQIELTLDDSRLQSAYLVLDALQSLKQRLKQALKAKDLPKGEVRNRLNELLTQCSELCKQYKELRSSVARHKDRTQEDIRALTTASGVIGRMLADTCRVIAGRSGRTAGPSWTDGSPSTVRGVSKYFAYVSALLPATGMAIATSQRIGDSLALAKAAVADAANLANAARAAKAGWTAAAAAGGASTAVQACYANEPSYWVPTVMPEDVTLTSSQIKEALQPHAAASGTTAFVAILGWNLRNVLFDPLYQHIIHAGIGVVERLASSCASNNTTTGASGMTVTTTLPPSVGVDADHQQDDLSGACSEAETRSGSNSLPGDESEDSSKGKAKEGEKDKEEADGNSDRQSGTSSESFYEIDPEKFNASVQDMLQQLTEIQTSFVMQPGDAETNDDWEAALNALTSQDSGASTKDSSTSSNG